MLIVCPSCETSYQITLAALGDAGRTVRCASCKNRWFATPESAVMEAQTAPVPVAAAAGGPAPKDDFTDETAGNFALPGGASDEFEAAEAEKMVAVDDAPPLAPEDTAPAAAKFDPGTP